MVAKAARVSGGKLFTKVSRARVTARSLLGAVERLDAAAKPKEGTHASSAQDALRSALAEWHAALATAQLEKQVTGLEGELLAEGELYPYAEGAWGAASGLSRLIDRWPPKRKPGKGYVDAASTIVVVEETRTILQQVVYECSKVTVIDELHERLATLRVGKALDFHKAFQETLPDQAHRKALLTELKNRKFGGWVEEGTGLIYRLPGNTVGMVFACFAPLFFALLAGGALYGFSSLSLPWNELEEEGGVLLGIYGLVMIGVVGQLLVENVKQSLSGSVKILAISDTTYWIALRWVGLSQSVIAAVIVTIGLRLSGIEGDAEGLALCIAAGYSVDSVAGIFLTRFHSKAVDDLKVLNERLGGTEGTDKSAQAPAPA